MATAAGGNNRASFEPVALFFGVFFFDWSAGYCSAVLFESVSRKSLKSMAGSVMNTLWAYNSTY